MKKNKNKKDKRKKILTKEQRYAKNKEAVRFWSRRIDKSIMSLRIKLNDNEIPKLGIVTYINREKRYGYIFDEEGKSHKFYHENVLQRKHLEWNKPVLFVLKGEKLKVLAIPAREIVRERGASLNSNSYRSFGINGKGRVTLLG